MKVMAALDIRFDISSSADDGHEVLNRVRKASVDENLPKPSIGLLMRLRAIVGLL